jgi:hypothetical protein
MAFAALEDDGLVDNVVIVRHVVEGSDELTNKERSPIGIQLRGGSLPGPM